MTNAAAKARTTGLKAFLPSATLAALIWFLLLGSDPASWVIGIPCVLLCTWYSGRVRPARQLRVSFSGWLQLLPYFIRSSIAGGWDVARRVLKRELAINPGFFHYQLHIPTGSARTFFIQFIGLLPGTLGASMKEDHLIVHVLNLDADHENALREAEQRVAAAFATGITP